jgi:hypothetical protein
MPHVPPSKPVPPLPVEGCVLDPCPDFIAHVVDARGIYEQRRWPEKLRRCVDEATALEFDHAVAGIVFFVRRIDTP